MKKSMVKRWMAIVMAFVICIGMLGGCSLKSETGETGASASGESNGEASDSKENDSEFVYRVGFVNIDNADTACYPAMQKFVEYVESDEFAKSVGADKVEVLTADSAKDIEKQTTNVETLLSKGVDMMFIIGVDTQGNTTSVNACNAEGVPVFMVGTEASGGEWKFIGFDETELGRRQGEWCAANLPENSKICYLQGTPGREATVMREEGFMEGISSRDDLEVISSQNGDFDAATAMQVTEDWIQAYGDEINCIASANSTMITGAIEALKAARMNENVTTVGVVHIGEEDGYPIPDGDEDYAIFVSWPEIGTLCGQIAEKYYNGEEIEDRTNIELEDMTAENFDEIVAAQ
ncbi:MAG: sugar ABC transporter substrate-binding protein [Ruminococcus sp.]|jgi:ABC-type sugar transport system substrate-binding protein